MFIILEKPLQIWEYHDALIGLKIFSQVHIFFQGGGYGGGYQLRDTFRPIACEWLFGTLETRNEILKEKDLALVLSTKMAARESKEIVFSEIKNKFRRSTLYQKEKLRKAKEKRERKRKRKREESQEEGEVSRRGFCKQVMLDDGVGTCLILKHRLQVL